MSNSLFRVIQSRLPERRDALQVFGVVLFAVFGWSIRGFLYKIPSFTLYFGLSTNLAVLCYMLSFALLESLVIIGCLLALAALLPARVLKEGFAYKGFLIVLVAALAMIVFEFWYRVDFFKDMMNGQYYMVAPFVMGSVSSIIVLAGLLWLFHVRPRWQKYLVYAAEQLGIFTYIYVPLGLIGFLVVLVRNFP